MRRVIGIGCGAVGVAVAVALLIPTPACTNHQCDPSSILGADKTGTPTLGHVVPDDPNSWESTPLDGPWLQFNGQETIYFYMPPQFANREITSITPYLAVAADPFDAGSVWVVGAGNSVEFSVLSAPGGGPTEPPTIGVFNDTCAQYWLRLVITFAPGELTDAGAPDANATPDADAAPNDSSDADDASDGATE
jgi:hypothetical protein